MLKSKGLIVLTVAMILTGCSLSNVDEKDSDGDGTPDRQDECPLNPNKRDRDTVCGCAENSHDGNVERAFCTCIVDGNNVCSWDGNDADNDTDGDGIINSEDECPFDPNKKTEGDCGCGNEESGCEKPVDVDDPPPEDPPKPGTPGTPTTPTDPVDPNPPTTPTEPDEPEEIFVSTPDDLDGDKVANEQDPCPYNPYIKNDDDVAQIGKNSCAAYRDKILDIYPGSFIEADDLSGIEQINIHGEINLKDWKKYEPSACGVKSCVENASINVPSNIKIVGKTYLDKEARIEYTKPNSFDDSNDRINLRHPLFSDLNGCTLQDLHFDIDFYNDSGDGQLYGGIANTIDNATIANIGYTGEFETKAIPITEELPGEDDDPEDDPDDPQDLVPPDADEIGIGALFGTVSHSSISKIYAYNISVIGGFGPIGGLIGIVKDSDVTVVPPPEHITTEADGRDPEGGDGDDPEQTPIVYTISQLQVEQADVVGGLFGKVDSAKSVNIEDIHIYKVSANNGSNVGGLIGEVTQNSTITLNKISVEEVTSGGNGIGGLVGANDNKNAKYIITNIDIEKIQCTYTNNNNNSYCGGLIGISHEALGIDAKLLNINLILGEGYEYVGGLIGAAQGISSNAMTASKINLVRGNSKVGGLVGGSLDDDENDFNIKRIGRESDVSDNMVDVTRVEHNAFNTQSCDMIGGLFGRVPKLNLAKADNIHVAKVDATGCRGAGGMIGVIDKSLKLGMAENIALESVSALADSGGVIGRSEDDSTSIEINASRFNVGEVLCGQGACGGFIGLLHGQGFTLSDIRQTTQSLTCNNGIAGGWIADINFTNDANDNANSKIEKVNHEINKIKQNSSLNLSSGGLIAQITNPKNNSRTLKLSNIISRVDEYCLENEDTYTGGLIGLSNSVALDMDDILNLVLKITSDMYLTYTGLIYDSYAQPVDLTRVLSMSDFPKNTTSSIYSYSLYHYLYKLIANYVYWYSFSGARIYANGDTGIAAITNDIFASAIESLNSESGTTGTHWSLSEEEAIFGNGNSYKIPILSWQP